MKWLPSASRKVSLPATSALKVSKNRHFLSVPFARNQKKLFTASSGPKLFLKACSAQKRMPHKICLKTSSKISTKQEEKPRVKTASLSLHKFWLTRSLDNSLRTLRPLLVREPKCQTVMKKKRNLIQNSLTKSNLTSSKTSALTSRYQLR